MYFYLKKCVLMDKMLFFMLINIICCAMLFAQSPQGLIASLSLKPRRLFISFARTKETKQRKFAVCTFWATPASVSAKQKELATLKQLFVFNAPTLTSALRPKSEAGPLCFFATLLRSLGCGVFFFCFALFCHPERSKA